MLSVRRRKSVISVITCLAVGLGTTFVGSNPSAAAGPVPGTRPAEARTSASAMSTQSTEGLQLVVNERGRISQSTSALGTLATEGALRVRKPHGATVRGAWLAYATVGFSGAQIVPGMQPSLAGQPVPISNELLNGISSFNYFADVSDIVKPIVDAAPAGNVDIPVTEPDSYTLEGEMLVVVFDDPAVTEPQSVSLLYGGLATGGDSYRVQLEEPIDRSDPATRLEMSLGITYSYQTGGTQQSSNVAVNAQPLTAAAGGEDDGVDANGALITVGGIGDSLDNPVDPTAYPVHPRSDDELYDLRPFVADGDRAIEVTTNNPSADDNVMLATFTMNPPVTDIDSGRQMVMVSLGDSYQSGEGAGSAYDDSAAYYLHAYENGENYPQAPGGQEDTLTPGATGGNGCHRALQNYPKLVAAYLADDYDVTLVDVTCSGAKIERGSKPPLVGDLEGGVIEADAQVSNALARLSAVGLQRDDVDVVTVGMGGNDAKFADLVTACLAPTLARRLLAAYDQTPGLVSWLANRLTCERLDRWVFHASGAIDTLAEKERFAQRKLREAFPRADIFQVDYPGVLPDPDVAPSWCGGIGAEDIEYADIQARRINDVVRDTVAEAYEENAALDRYFQIVEVDGAFGGNALCPSDPADALANGIDRENFDREVERLLTDPVLRPRLDEVSDSYRSLRNCLARATLVCDAQARTDRFTEALRSLVDQIRSDDGFFETVLANITKPPSSGEPEAARLDRSQGLFHPNLPGIEVLACYVHGTVTFLGTLECPNADTGARSFGGAGHVGISSTGGLGATLEPIQVDGPGTEVTLDLPGYAAGAPVEVTRYGESVAVLTADDDGVVRGPLALPAAPPGVQVLEVRGETAAGAWIGHDLRLAYPGRPQLGQDYSFYVDGLESRPDHIDSTWVPESVTVTYAGATILETVPDRAGGILVTVPVPDQWPDEPVEVVVAGSRSGVVERVRLDQAPITPAIWAVDGDLTFSGAGSIVELMVHAERDVRLHGAGSSFVRGVEHVLDLLVSPGTTVEPAAAQVAAGAVLPTTVGIDDFRPGEIGALRAGEDYREVSESQCAGGAWRPSAADLEGVVYVPCDVTVTGRGLDVEVTLAAEGSIAISGSRGRLSSFLGSGPLIVAGGDVRIAGARTFLGGPVLAAGDADLSGNGMTSWCGVIANSIRVTGSHFTAGLGGPCASP